jgi:O-antigen/teichoic acid export membrane protein
MSARGSLERRAVFLGTANAVDYALQFLLPIVLTRALDPHSFGEYRLLWLGVSTVVAIAPMFMSESLYFFLPRSDKETKRLYVHQTMIWMLFAGLLSAWALSVLDPFLPATIHPVSAGNAITVPLFVLLWIMSYLLDVLPTVEERVRWQANVIVILSAVRALALSTVAIVTHELTPVLWTLAAFAAFKLGLLVFYIAREHGLRGPYFRWSAFSGQLRYAAPFGLSGTLHGFRGQADQWVAAALFPVSMFASFSIATVIAPMVQLFRQSVNHVFLPSMSRSHSEGDVASMLALNSRANAIVALLVFPLLAFAFVFAEPLIACIYTPQYLEAVPVMRLYIVALVAFVVELNSILLLLKQGPFAARVNAAVLLLALPLSYGGALVWGLPGAALGSATAVFVERAISLARISRLVGIPVSRLQDWATLAGLLAAAAISALAAGTVLGYVHLRPFFALAAGGLLLAIVYPAALYVTGQMRELTRFIASLRNAGAQGDISLPARPSTTAAK